MQRALDLARRGWGSVHPNPLVGAVVVKDGTVVGEGWHAEYGGPHAEVVALAQAGPRARGADLYVTLEPCTHHGLTPPCTEAVQRAGIRRVLAATRDPHPKAAGGARILAEHGIEVVLGMLERDGRSLNAAFFHVHERKTPFVALKLALSLDGCISAAPGSRTLLTSERALEEAHRLRAGFDAIMVGSGTANVDDPLLTVRGPVKPRVPPIRVVIDTDARTRADGKLARTARDVPLWILYSRCTDPGNVDALRDAGARTIAVPGSDSGVSLERALASLWESGVRTILCEGGGKLATRLLSEDRVERAYFFYAPVFLGPDGVPAFSLENPVSPGDWRLLGTGALDPDALLVWERVRDQPA
jgi:diaminohydroxyphosphoribosylaminopyrimidine deaminase/5-amino-6-(5-phosphoribosylamino)uracil reductase